MTLGCYLVNACLGLFSVWLIVEGGIVASCHVVVFVSSLKMPNDPYLLYASRFERRMMGAEAASVVVETQPPVRAAQRQVLYDQLRNQRTQFYEQSRKNLAERGVEMANL